ncbi:MAG TPA: monooxygenase [Sneathiellales bacterium]|jgi:propane monooxygenase coupling protein|nr:monooxygenase [Sneathiellales bacterium]
MSTQTFKDLKREDTVSHKCGVTMNESVDSRVIAEVMQEKPGVEVLYYPAMIRIDTEGKLTFDMEEISEALGREFTPYDFEVVMSTHYGRMVMIDENTVVLFGNMEEALQYEE